LLLLLQLLFSPRARLLAEILFLRRQLALFQERQAKARRPSRWSKLALVWLSKLFDWRNALVIVRPETFIRWHRAGFRLLWRWKSRRRGRPALPKNIKSLIWLMASENPSWGEERIADELSLKLGVLVSPRTVQKYLRCTHGPRGASSQRWSTFVRNHAQAIVACDFFTVVTASFSLYGTNLVFVPMKNGTQQRIAYDTGLHPWRNQYIQSPWEFQVSGSLFKVIPINDRFQLRLNLDAFNVLNQPGTPMPDAATGILSLRNSNNAPRQLQVTMRLNW
jgi:putative transposase